jgi:hypothetical protein
MSKRPQVGYVANVSRQKYSLMGNLKFLSRGNLIQISLCSRNSHRYLCPGIRIGLIRPWKPMESNQVYGAIPAHNVTAVEHIPVLWGEKFLEPC